MPEVVGTVSLVRELDKRDGQDPLVSVSVEGYSFLVRPDDHEVPEKGSLIRANVSTQWKKGKPPIHWLQAYDPIIGGRGGRE